MSRVASTGKNPVKGVPLPIRLLRKGIQPRASVLSRSPARALLSLLGISNPASKYLEGFDWVYKDDGKERLSIEVSLKKEKPTIALISSTEQGTERKVLAKLDFPSQSYTCGIRFYREVFSVEIWVTPSNGSTPYVWGIYLTSSLQDGRMRAAKKVWSVLRAAFQRLSLAELTYLDQPREHNDVPPTPPHPYELRKTSLRRRQRVIGNEETWILEMDIPERKPWIFTKHLANKDFTDLLEAKMRGGPEILPKLQPKKSRRKLKDGSIRPPVDTSSKRGAPADAHNTEGLDTPGQNSRPQKKKRKRQESEVRKGCK